MPDTYRPYVKGKYLHQGPHDIGKTAIPIKDRCEGFDELWNKTFEEVMKYWEWTEVTDISELTGKTTGAT